MKFRHIPGLPGWICVDESNALHISIPMFLEEMNVADTPANREAATKIAADVTSKLLPSVRIERVL